MQDIHTAYSNPKVSILIKMLVPQWKLKNAWTSTPTLARLPARLAHMKATLIQVCAD